MREIFNLIWLAILGAFRSRVSLEAEVLISSAQRTAAESAETADIPADGPSDIRELISFGSNSAGLLGYREAGDRD
jgi:hypothetical protein